MSNASGERRTSFAVSSESKSYRGRSGQDRWAIILAGGDGSRLLSLTRQISGDDRPKQFCPIINGHTLLDVTRRRVALGLAPKNTMFVLTQKHERYYNDALDGVPPANRIVQPRNAGTAPAILYSLLRLEQINPDAAVAFFPSDHYFSDDQAFMSEVSLAFDAASRHKDSVVLFGIEPDSPDEEYGWIEPDREVSMNNASDLWRVRRFREKPSAAQARELMARGCLWNSFVMLGAISTFLKIIRGSTTELYARFSSVKSKLSTPTEKGDIQKLYAGLADSNFSHEVLQARPGDLLVFPVRSSKWSDLGNPGRVFSTLSDVDGSFLKRNSAATHLAKSAERFYERTMVRCSEIV